MEFDVRLTIEFSRWLDGLTDKIAAAAVAERLLRVRRGLFGDHASVGDRVSELRIHHGPGYRVYYTVRDRVVVFMLAGGLKRTQERDIDRAKTLEQAL
jgi:putative addiction module killer protein